MLPLLWARDFPASGSEWRNEVVRRDLHLACGGFRDGLALHEDWDFRLRLARRARGAWTGEMAGVYYRASGLSHRTLAENVDALRRIRALNLDLLSALPEALAREADTQLRRTLARAGRQAAREARANGRRAVAWRQYVGALTLWPGEPDLALGLRLLLPRRLPRRRRRETTAVPPL